MSAPLPVLKLDPRAYDRALSCVHCGLCLPACPTYNVTGHEADSPRGRIQLMRGLAEGTVELTDSVRGHLDLCLDCRGCETACPSGVVYHELLEETRHRMAEQTVAKDRFLRWVFLNILTRPTRLKLALLPARLMQRIGLYQLIRKTGVMRLLPPGLRKMEQMLPERGALWPRALPERVAGTKARVVFLQGCVGSVMFADVNRMAVELLAAAGAAVHMPRAMRCCGAIHQHNGATEDAREMARRNIDAAWPAGAEPPDFITTTIAGCGAMLHEYDHLLRDDPGYADRAAAFAARVKDITEVLLAVGLPETKHPVDETVTYHEACHLAHAQKVTGPPRKILSAIPGLKLVALPESDMCCGAAGTYNLTQPEMATSLARRKLSNVAATGARLCVTGNAGCAMHIQSQAIEAGQDVKVVHPIELLHRAVFGTVN